MRVRNVYPGDANSDTYLGDLKPSELICCLLTFVQIQHLSEHVEEKAFLGQSDTWRVRCCQGELSLAGWQWVLCFLCTLSSPRHQTPEFNALGGLWFYSSMAISHTLNNIQISAVPMHVSSCTALRGRGMQCLWLLVTCSRIEVGKARAFFIFLQPELSRAHHPGAPSWINALRREVQHPGSPAASRPCADPLLMFG